MLLHQTEEPEEDAPPVSPEAEGSPPSSIQPRRSGRGIILGLLFGLPLAVFLWWLLVVAVRLLLHWL